MEAERLMPLSGTVAAGSAIMAVGGDKEGVDVAEDSFRDLDLNENFCFGATLAFSPARSPESCLSCYCQLLGREGVVLLDIVSGHTLGGKTRFACTTHLI